MVKADLVGRKVSRASAWLDDAEALFHPDPPRSDLRGQERDLAAFYLMLAIQECLDLAAHWVSDAGWTPPDSAAACFGILADRGAIDPALAVAMRQAAGLRNRIAHGYASLDQPRLAREAGEGIGQLRRFLARILDEADL